MEAPDPITRVRSLERALLRERSSRERAEQLLETKSRELYLLNEDLQEQHARISRRNQEIERAHSALQDAQARLVQSEKLASVGQLAAGVAHEINNPIGFIMSNLGTLQSYVGAMRKLLVGYREIAAMPEVATRAAAELEPLRALEEQEDIQFVLEDIEELITDSVGGTKRVKEIVRGLKSFSRVDDTERAPADINSGIEATLKVVANQIKYSCDIELELTELPPVSCNLAQLNQVFLNLLVNAAQAIDGHGTVTIRSFVAGDSAVVEVQDTGSGIPADVIGSVFDPFFTTKPVGTGTGLGLSISYGIVEEHGGKLSVESLMDAGTTFTVTLPIAGQDTRAS